MKIFPAVVFLLGMLTFFNSCKEEDGIEPPVIESFSPVSGIGPSDGAEGTNVVITGAHFSTLASDNTVMFNGTAATVKVAAKTYLITSVPAEATTGKITVTVKGQSVVSEDDFVVIPPPVIQSFDPVRGSAGTAITIQGSGFSSALNENVVKFRDVAATVSAASPSQLTVTVPAHAVSGKITVIVKGQSVISNADFTVLDGPVITSFSPEAGSAGATVTIRGINFSNSPSENRVTFNTVEAVVTSSTETEIVTSVPFGGFTGKIRVTVGEATAVSAKDFQILYPPTIEWFTPASAAAGALVRIAGVNFSSVVAENIIRFNGVAATVVSATTAHLEVTVPAGATTGKISIEVNGNASASVNDFTVVPAPEIFSVEPGSGMPPAVNTGLPGSTISITGSHFNAVGSDNVVRFNGTVAYVSSASATQLTVTVPAGAATGKISVTTSGVTVESASDFAVLPRNTWHTMADFANGLRRSGACGFVIKSKIYMGLGQDENNGHQKDFWMFDTETNTWTRKKDFPGLPRSHAVAFSVGSRGYICLGSGGPQNYIDVWEYDPVANDWTQKKDFPGQPRTGAVAFAIRSKGYVGTGASASQVKLSDFWEFDPVADTWTQKASIGAPRQQAFAFTADGKGYVGGDLSISAKDLWEFDSFANTWTSRALIPESNNSAPSFSIGRKGYVSAGGKLWMFDPVANQWTPKASPPIPLTFSCGFALEDACYLGTGLEPGFVKTASFFEYIPD